MSEFLADLARSSATRSKRTLNSSASLPAEEHVRLGEASSTAENSSMDLQTSIDLQTPMDLHIYLKQIELFNHHWYLTTYPDVAQSSVDPCEHFFSRGHAEGRRPNIIFDPSWYLAAYPDVKSNGLNPLLHYALYGEQEGRQPSPYFEPTWYRNTYSLLPNQNALAHYLKNRFGPFSPIPEFDAKYYLDTYKDVAAANVDPFEHYLHVGYRENRNPSSQFDTRFYVTRYLKNKIDQNPLIHYREHRGEDGVFPQPQENEATIPSQVKRFTKPGPQFEELRPLLESHTRRVKLLAYYLPQFHAFPENDKWWGTGFTEWTNIARGIPRFKDHYQPRIPRDLGFYSLENTESMRKQISLAKLAGLHGFIFYYYWFNGKRLLEKPLENFLKAADIDMPFCLMWANENWTRRWDGMDGEVLISQGYRTDDDECLVEDFAQHFADPRYIRLEGRPLLMIYRPRLIPEAAKVIARWRSLLTDRFNENPIIVMGQSFDDEDPRSYCLDGAIEFPPHKVTKNIPLANHEMQILDDSFTGQIYKFDDVVKYSLDEPAAEFPLIKTVIPSWDNDARRQGAGLVIQGSTPVKYEMWLSALVERAQRKPFFGEPIVCVNAWNEWCEGAYLEPDVYFGSAYLNATARAITGFTRDSSSPRLLLVGHDAFPSGAQQLLLNIGRTLRRAFGLEIEYLLLAGGVLEADYSAVAPLTVVKDPGSLAAKIRELRERGFSATIVNTSAAGDAAAMLSANGFNTVLLIHELPQLLKEKRLEASARAGIAAAQHVVFPAGSVGHKVIEALGIADSEKLLVRPQGSYKRITAVPAKAAEIRRELGIATGSPVVLGVGYADMRKGFDLFLQLWRLLRPMRPQVHFVWVGGIDPSLQEWLGREITEAVGTGTFHMAGFRRDIAPFFTAANAFVLTSREDPFPTVVLEAMSMGVPVVAFEDSGGIPEFLTESSSGLVVPYCDLPAMADKLRQVFSGGIDNNRRIADQENIRTNFAFTPYVRDLVRLALPKLSSVSVVVPNYNYAHCLKERLYTIFDQTYPVEQVIVLDDASSDSSVSVVKAVAAERKREISLAVNKANSGSVFAQWAKAARLAVGEFVWIAEADDLSEPSFLANLLAMMHADPAIGIAFCDSKSIDANGSPVYASYKPYFASIEPNALTRSEVFDGAAFAERFLSAKNTILNVSSVLWRREVLQRALAACQKELAHYRMAGDWRIYLETLAVAGVRIAYVADPLNVHRRHAQSVTHALRAEQHVAEIAKVHNVIRQRFRLSQGAQNAQAAYFAEVSRQLLGVAPQKERRKTPRTVRSPALM